jgi:hypothetical protein
MGNEWTVEDRAQLEERGISTAEIERQLALFKTERKYTALLRACTLEDGIEQITEEDIPGLHSLQQTAAATGRFTKFVPASGAASRMFQTLLHYLKGPGSEDCWPDVLQEAESGEVEAGYLLTFIRELDRFAFRNDLGSALEAEGDPATLVEAGSFRLILDALLGPSGLNYERLPKGLLKFHHYPDGSRTPFEEHLVEAAHFIKDESGNCQLHFTVSPEHRALFARLFEERKGRYQEQLGATFSTSYSEQKRSTDTLAVDLDNQPIRDDAGNMTFRPGGHGSLIDNLDDLQADLIYIKNIDNVQPDRLRQTTLDWKRILGGYLVQIQQQVHESLKRLKNKKTGLERLERELNASSRRLLVGLNGNLGGASAEIRREFLINRLNRPIRVCGVVKNTGEPGGGPFWVRGEDGMATLQIVESAEVDPDDKEQQRILRSSTHFNPVDLVCAVKDARGKNYDLQRFVDPEAGIISTKTAGGRELRALERPGLWNGAMAGWNTIFVEVPMETFTPVKTVLDLLRDIHQP